MMARVRPILQLSSSFFAASVLISAALLLSSQVALAQFTQQGPKLLGSGAAGGAEQGYSVALSADGNTAIVGAFVDSGTGDAFVYTRSGGVWTQQGSKLVGTGVVNPPGQESGLGRISQKQVGVQLVCYPAGGKYRPHRDAAPNDGPHHWRRLTLVW
jgi:FG-GAP repeat